MIAERLRFGDHGEIAAAERWAHEIRVEARGTEDRRVRAFELRAYGGARLEDQMGMIPRVVTDCISVLDDAAHGGRVGRDGAAHDEEGGAHVLVLQDVEDAVRVRWVRPVVEGERPLRLRRRTLHESLSEELVSRSFERFVAEIGQGREHAGERSETESALHVRSPRRARACATFALNDGGPKSRKPSTSS